MEKRRETGKLCLNVPDILEHLASLTFVTQKIRNIRSIESVYVATCNYISLDIDTNDTSLLLIFIRIHMILYAQYTYVYARIYIYVYIDTFT